RRVRPRAGPAARMSARVSTMPASVTAAFRRVTIPLYSPAGAAAGCAGGLGGGGVWVWLGCVVVMAPQQPAHRAFDAVVRSDRASANHSCELVRKAEALLAYGRGHSGARGDLVDQRPELVALGDPVDDTVQQAF